MKKKYTKPTAKVDMYPNLEALKQGVSVDVRDALAEEINIATIMASKTNEILEEQRK